MMTSMFYNYIHKTADTGQVFYVGKGKGQRAWSRARNKKWHNVATKHGHVVEIVWNAENEQESLDYEVWLIDLHETYHFDNPRGLGCNFTRGGESGGLFADKVHPSEWRKNHSIRMTGSGNPMFGKPSPIKGKTMGPRVPRKNKVCPICVQDFDMTNKDQVCCSRSCANRLRYSTVQNGI